MLTKTRQKLSRFRQNGSPLASFVDFALWTLRSVLTPGKRTFWFLLFVVSMFVVAWVFTPYKIYIAYGLVLFLSIFLLSLILSYFRTISRTHTHALGVARQEIGSSLTEIREQQITSALNLETLIDSRYTELDGRLDQTNTGLQQSLDASSQSFEAELDIIGERLVDLAKELQSLRVHSTESIQNLADKQDAVDNRLTSMDTELTANTKKSARSNEKLKKVSKELLSDLSSIKDQLDYSSGNEAGTIEYLCDSIDELRRQLLEVKVSRQNDA